MGDRIAAQPDRLDAFSGRTVTTLAPAWAETSEYSRALAAYRYAPDNDLGSACLVDLAPQVEGVLSDLAALDELPAAFARALRALDSRVGPMVQLEADHGRGFDAAVEAALADADATAAELREAADVSAEDATPTWKVVWNSYDHPTGAYGSVVNLANLGRWNSAAQRLSAIEYRATVSHLDLHWTGLNRAGRRAMASRLNRAARPHLSAARQAADVAEEALIARQGPLARYGSRVATRFPTVARYAPVAGKTLGVVGVGLQSLDAYESFQDERYVDAGFSTAGAVGGALLLVAGGPVTIGVGSALVLGSLAYEYRDEVADAARWTAGKVSDGAGWLADKAGDGLGALAGAFGF